jgi:Family of unknown function (DUF5372)
VTPVPVTVTITRPRHPLRGRSLRVLGGMRRHGAMELLLELPDGTKALVPAAWTNAQPPLGGDAGRIGTLGSLADLLHVGALIAELRGQAAGMSPCKEDSHAACPAQFDTRSGPGPEQRSGPDASTGGADGRAAARRGGQDGDRVAGQRDCQSDRDEPKGGVR